MARRFNSRAGPSKSEKAIEECAVAFERLAQIFSIDAVTAIPLLLQLLAFRGELLGDAPDDVGDQAVCLLDSRTGLIDERGLHAAPTRAKALELVLREERGGTRLRTEGGSGLRVADVDDPLGDAV